MSLLPRSQHLLTYLLGLAFLNAPVAVGQVTKIAGIPPLHRNAVNLQPCWDPIALVGNTEYALLICQPRDVDDASSAPASTSAPSDEDNDPQSVDKPRPVTAVLAQLNRMIDAADIPAEYWKPTSKENRLGIPPDTPATGQASYDACLQTIQNSGVLLRQVRVRVTVKTVGNPQNGAIELRGTCSATQQELNTYITKQERESIRAKNEEIARSRESSYQRTSKPSPSAIASRRRTLERHNRELDELTRNVNAAAQKRKDQCETVAVDAQLPADMITAEDLAKLSLAYEVTVVASITGFEIRAPIADVDQPAAVGRICCNVLSIESSRGRK